MTAKYPLMLVALALTSAVPAPALAHHSFAMFDMTRQVTVSGTVSSFEFTNPHIWINLTANDPKTGQPVQWGIEGGSPNTLARAGWTHSTIRSGDKVTITMHPLRDGRPGGSLVALQSGNLKIGT